MGCRSWLFGGATCQDTPLLGGLGREVVDGFGEGIAVGQGRQLAPLRNDQRLLQGLRDFDVGLQVGLHPFQLTIQTSHPIEVGVQVHRCEVDALQSSLVGGVITDTSKNSASVFLRR